MSVSTVFATCPHCGLEYWLVIDLTVVERLEKSVTCGKCKKPFDLRERLADPPGKPSAPPPFEVEDEPDSFEGRAKFSKVDKRMRHSWFAAAVPGGLVPEPEPPPDPEAGSEPRAAAIESEPAIAIRPYFSQPPLEIDVGDLSEFEPVLVLEPPRLPREATGNFLRPHVIEEPPEMPEPRVSLELDLASMMPPAKLPSEKPPPAKLPSGRPRRKLVVPQPITKKKR